MIVTLAACAVLAALISLGVTALVWKAGVLDMPGHRSLHASPTPRGGGIGMIAAAGAVFACLALLPVPQTGALPVLALATIMGALGVSDDLFALPSAFKFGFMIAATLLLGWFIGVPAFLGLAAGLHIALPVWAGLAGAALFLFVVVNAVNFMDGSDGMMAAGLVPAGLGLTLAGLMTGQPDVSFAGAALTGGLAGFLVLNRPPARVFAGDGGSLAAGALYAGGALAMAGDGLSGTLWLAPLFVLPYLADVLLTMAARAAGGRLSLDAHREHLYQRLVAGGWSHQAVALAYALAGSVCVAAGLLALLGPQGATMLVFALMAGVMSLLYVAGGRHARQLIARRQ